jgi:hypothetical protein
MTQAAVCYMYRKHSDSNHLCAQVDTRSCFETKSATQPTPACHRWVLFAERATRVTVIIKQVSMPDLGGSQHDRARDRPGRGPQAARTEPDLRSTHPPRRCTVLAPVAGVCGVATLSSDTMCPPTDALNPAVVACRF